MPQSKWVLKKLTRDDGTSLMAAVPSDRGIRVYSETYNYSDGYYDRNERLFYGFAEVATTKPNGAIATARYRNNDYYTRGMNSGGELKGPDVRGDTVLYQESLVDVHVKALTTVHKPSGDTVDICFPQVLKETSRQYEPESTRYVETSRTYKYDDLYGNVVDLFDNGTTGERTQVVHAIINYDYNISGADYQKQSPSAFAWKTLSAP